MKNLYLLTGILSVSISTALASAPVPPPAPSFKTSPVTALHPTTPGARPDNAADRANGIGADAAVDTLAGAPTTAGVRSKAVVRPMAPAMIFSLSGEYNYINTDDSRAFGSDFEAHTATIAGSVFMNGNTFLGLNYSYTNGTQAPTILGTSSHSDAHFISLVAARSFGQWLSVGVVGGYGHTDYTLNTAGVKTGANMETWSVSPFVTASYRSGRLTSSLTTAYAFETDHTSTVAGPNNDDTGKFSIALRESYAASERVKIQVTAKFTEVLNGLGVIPGLPQARNWATFGTRISYQPTKSVELYGGYSFDAFNRFLETHTVTAGLKYSF